LHLHNDCVGQEGIKVEVLLQDCGSQSYRCVYRVLEQNVLVLGRYKILVQTLS
jgi:hypothetical protein